MLRYLQIRDFAIIDSIEIEFLGGLTVLTGETGAGKSIIVDALELLAGGRAGADVVRSGAERADIAATIDVSGTGGELRHLLDEHSISSGGELQLRRVVGSDGRSRAWLGGQSVPLQVLSRAAELLFDIHGQHEFQSLVRPATQRQLVDGYGHLEALASQVRSAHSAWLTLLNRSLEIESAADERGTRLDWLRHQVQEIEALGLRAGELPSSAPSTPASPTAAGCSKRCAARSKVCMNPSDPLRKHCWRARCRRCAAPPGWIRSSMP